MNEKIGRVLAIDYGSVRIGLALSDPLQIIATGLTTIANSERSIRELVEIISRYEVTKVLIGLPLTLKGEHGGKRKKFVNFPKNFSSWLPFRYFIMMNGLLLLWRNKQFAKWVPQKRNVKTIKGKSMKSRQPFCCKISLIQFRDERALSILPFILSYSDTKIFPMGEDS